MNRLNPEQIYTIYGYIRQLCEHIHVDIMNIIFMYFPHFLKFHPPTHHDPDLEHYLEYNLSLNTVERKNSIGWGSCIFGDNLCLNSFIKYKLHSFDILIKIEWGICEQGAEIHFGFVFSESLKIHKFKWDKELGGRKNQKYSVGLWFTENGGSIYIMSPYSRCKKWYKTNKEKNIKFKNNDIFKLNFDLIDLKLNIYHNNIFIGDTLNLNDYKNKYIIPAFSLKGFGTKINIIDYKYQY